VDAELARHRIAVPAISPRDAAKADSSGAFSDVSRRIGILFPLTISVTHRRISPVKGVETCGKKQFLILIFSNEKMAEMTASTCLGEADGSAKAGYPK
jgi:hypothetical protein